MSSEAPRDANEYSQIQANYDPDRNIVYRNSNENPDHGPERDRHGKLIRIHLLMFFGRWCALFLHLFVFSLQIA